jgi:SAM-dependent methyltransferase
MDHSFDQDYWDRIWTSGRAAAMSTSDPNPHLVREVDGLTPATAIDAGCGAGAEAIWLARRGWQVTAVDVVDTALALGEERAVAAGVGGQVHWVRADLSTWAPDVTYDLVTTHYAHPAMPQLEFYDRIASWVAPGGTLLVVGHLHGGDQDHAGGPPDSASATAAAVTDRLDPAAWEIATADELQRTVPGAQSGHPTTLRDVVVRAVRRR